MSRPSLPPLPARVPSRVGASCAHGPRFVFVLALLLAPAVACRSAVSLANGQSSSTALAAAVLAALERRDEPALRALAIDEGEFGSRVWPELPASRPERNLPFSYVWGDLRQKSEVGLARTLASYGGQRRTLVEVTFTGGVTQYPTFLVHRDAVLTVADSSGVRSELRAFGSVIEQDGLFKAFSYVVD